ncbi:MAG: DUF4296 domain-containing protein [Lutibacter sp.]|uniref:DUF4296 domain-containing protein n=1 Tax=Lutibacter sp. TaxID=1925666 RepID=UPI00299D4109|nr:DUF4296 domain-containing protein [Lutibacter sp.]MDX1829701.1 DUF4296 domain-containing protein [Lutibacter sp.]
MKKIIYIAVLSVLVISCTSNTILKKPKDLIPKDEMVNIITDMLIASSAQQIKNKELMRNVNYFPLIFEKYHIDSTRFKSSNFYYTSQIDEYDVILKEVKERLSAQKKIVDSIRKVEDSISRAKKIKPSVKKVNSTEPKRKIKLDSIKKTIGSKPKIRD